MKNGGLLLWLGAFLLIVGGGVCVAGMTDGGSSGDEPAGLGASMLIAGLLLWERGKRKESRSNNTRQVEEKSAVLPVIIALLVLSGLSSAANAAAEAESSADSAQSDTEQLESRVDRIESYLSR